MPGTSAATAPGTGTTTFTTASASPLNGSSVSVGVVLRRLAALPVEQCDVALAFRLARRAAEAAASGASGGESGSSNGKAEAAAAQARLEHLAESSPRLAGVLDACDVHTPQPLASQHAARQGAREQVGSAAARTAASGDVAAMQTDDVEVERKAGTGTATANDKTPRASQAEAEAEAEKGEAEAEAEDGEEDVVMEAREALEGVELAVFTQATGRGKAALWRRELRRAAKGAGSVPCELLDDDDARAAGEFALCAAVAGELPKSVRGKGTIEERKGVGEGNEGRPSENNEHCWKEKKNTRDANEWEARPHD